MALKAVERLPGISTNKEDSLLRTVLDHRRWLPELHPLHNAGDAWVEMGLFTTDTGCHIEPRNLNTAFERLLRRSDLDRIRFHDLRPTCATLLRPGASGRG
jgi:integrase